MALLILWDQSRMETPGPFDSMVCTSAESMALPYYSYRVLKTED